MAQVFGMDVVYPEDDVRQPLEAVSVIKYLDADGDVAFGVTCTGSLSSVEATGMLIWALDRIRRATETTEL